MNSFVIKIKYLAMNEKSHILKNIVQNAPFPMAFLFKDDLIIQLANPAMIETWGKGNQVIGRKYIDVIQNMHSREIINQAMHVLKTGISLNTIGKKIDIKRKGITKSYYFNYSFIPSYDKEGNIDGIINTVIDKTDLHDSRQETLIANEKLKMAIDVSGIGTYQINLSTKKIDACENFKNILSIDELIDIDVLISKLHIDDLNIRENAHKEAENKNLISYEARIINKDKTERWVKITEKIIRYQNGEAETIIGTILDINMQKQFEKELEKQVVEKTENLVRSNDDLLHFANIVSHDLKEPVRKIKIFNNLLKTENKDYMSENSRKYFDKLDQSAQRMQNIIEGVLAYSTINKLTQPVEKINLEEIIENIKIDLELVIKEKDATFIIDKLPYMEGAPILIHQLFYNLIQNALKFSKPDQPPRVIITSEIIKAKDTDFLQIKIKDNGIGLDAIYSDKIFNAFERLHSKDDYEGNGLGLSFCRKIVSRHNGIITAWGEKNNGAEFLVLFPLLQIQPTI